MQLQLLKTQDTQKTIIYVPIGSLSLSRFNPRATRTNEQIDRLAERIQRNGFEITRALWVRASGDGYEVFAGGTRLEAARRAGVDSVPVVLHEGFTDEQVVRLADVDNENDEYHAPVLLTDIWADCWRLNEVEGWDFKKIGAAKGISESQAALRARLHLSLPKAAKKATVDGVFDEGHVVPILGVTVDVNSLDPWLTTEQAQTELTAEVLGKHRGSSVGIKPTVKVVREAASRWKEAITLAETHYKALDAPWNVTLVKQLAKDKARTVADVHKAMTTVTRQQAEAKRREEERLARERDAAEAEHQRLERKARHVEYVQSLVSRVQHGDARHLISNAPIGFRLLLTDPPYGKEYQSNRRTATGEKDTIPFDDAGAVDLLRDVLTQAYPRMADNAHAFIFVDWQHEPDFRTAIQEAGFALKGSLVWVKNNHGTGDLTGSFAPKHERIIHAVKGRPDLNHRHPDVLHGRDAQNSEHPTEKPQDLLRLLIEATTDEGDTVVDPFAGSGSTLYAAYATGRNFYGCEIDTYWANQIKDALYHLASQVQKEAA